MTRVIVILADRSRHEVETCPNCGESPRLWSGCWSHVDCLSCGMRGPQTDEPAEAVSRWNRISWCIRSSLCRRCRRPEREHRGAFAVCSNASTHFVAVGDDRVPRADDGVPVFVEG